MIYETIISTMSKDNIVKVSPFGIKKKDNLVLISPYLPSKTHKNLLRTKYASVSYTDNANIFVDCLTQKKKFEMEKCDFIEGFFLSDSLRHEEVKVVNYIKNEERPTFECEILHSKNHRAFIGINRARNALIEACILATRVNLLPKSKIISELNYLENAIKKTSGKFEKKSWRELVEYINSKFKKNE